MNGIPIDPDTIYLGYGETIDDRIAQQNNEQYFTLINKLCKLKVNFKDPVVVEVICKYSKAILADNRRMLKMFQQTTWVGLCKLKDLNFSSN